MSLAKRFKRVSCTNKQLNASDGIYFYYGVGTQQAKRVSFSDRDDNTAGTLGYDFGAGLKISDMFADTRQPGIVYAVVETIATGKYSVYRSSDSAMNFTFEKRLGDVDGTEANQLAGPRTLEGGTGITLHDFRDGSGLCLYIAEYNSPNLALDPVKILKRNGAGVWTDVWSSDGVVKHLHCIRSDPYSTHLFVGSGDTNEQCFVAEWDGKNPWVNGVLPQNAGVDGLWAIYGTQAHRAVDINFDQDYIYWFADTTISTGFSGIFRAKKNGLTGFKKVDAPISQLHGSRYGWHGVNLPNGNIAITCASNDDLNESCIFLYGKETIDKFALTGRFNQVNGSKGIPGGFRINYTNGVIWVAISAPAGRYDAFTGFYEVGEDFCEERPDNLCPMFFVGSTGVNDAATHGANPRTPFLTLAYAVSANHVTWGSAILLQNDLSDNKITSAWNVYPYGTSPNRGGQPGQPVQVVSADGTIKVFKQNSTDTNTNFFNFSHENQIIEFDRVHVTSEKENSDIFLGLTTYPSRVIFRDAITGQSGGVYANLVQYRALEVWSIRSEIYSGAMVTLNWDSAYGGHLKAIASQFGGNSSIAYYRGTGAVGGQSTLEMYNCSLSGSSARLVEQADATPAPMVIKNCVIRGATIGSVHFPTGVSNLGGVNYNSMSLANTPAGNNGANSFVGANNNFDYWQNSINGLPMSPRVRLGGVDIPENFPLPRFDKDKRPLINGKMPIGAKTNADLFSSDSSGGEVTDLNGQLLISVSPSIVTVL